MGASSQYAAFIEDLLSELPALTKKPFFGGLAFRSSMHGEDVQFGMVLNDTLYFVVDDSTRPKYKEKGMESFQYQKKSGAVFVEKYYTVPDECFEEQHAMMEWAKESLQIAFKVK